MFCLLTQVEILIELNIVSDSLAVPERLEQFDLSLVGLQKAIGRGLLAKLNVTPNYPKTAPGWYQYAETVCGLRDQFLGENWEKDSLLNIESIVNLKQGIKVAYASVDRSCSDSETPLPKSPKGYGTIEACSGNRLPQITEQLELVGEDFDTSRLITDTSTYYLMVDPEGRAELSLVLVGDDGEYVRFLERIYIIGSEDLAGFDEILIEDPSDDVEDDIEVNVVRK